MDILYFFQSIRTPVLDYFMSFITRCGEEFLFMAVALVFFWCINKFEGYYLMAVGFTGTVINQFLKILFRIPRPWVIDPKFKIVESARSAASGYSFPSGHTQSSVGMYGGIARWNKHRVLRIVCIVLCVLIPVSRMYLGVHTPLDVAVSLVIAIVLLLVFFPIISAAQKNGRIMWVLIGVMAAIAVANLIFVNTFNFPADTDVLNLASARENSAKLFGGVLGMAVVYFFDSKFLNFNTKAPFWGQVLKVVLGLILVLGIQQGLKPALNSLFSGNYIAHTVRYCIVVIVAGIVWPLTFKVFNRQNNSPEKENGDIK